MKATCQNFGPRPCASGFPCVSGKPGWHHRAEAQPIDTFGWTNKRLAEQRAFTPVLGPVE
jgi:hypothetical protein